MSTDGLFPLFRGVKSVYEFLKEKDGLAVLSDPDVEMATREVLANGRPRPQITKDIRRKVRCRCRSHLLLQDCFWRPRTVDTNNTYFRFLAAHMRQFFAFAFGDGMVLRVRDELRVPCANSGGTCVCYVQCRKPRWLRLSVATLP